MNVKKKKSGVLTVLLLTVGATAVAFGAGLIFLPAGFITGGVLAVAAGILLVLGGDTP